jgi:hypothetical protein
MVACEDFGETVERLRLRLNIRSRSAWLEIRHRYHRLHPLAVGSAQRKRLTAEYAALEALSPYAAQPRPAGSAEARFIHGEQHGPNHRCACAYEPVPA